MNKKLYDFIVNEFLVYDKENFSPEQIYEGQINEIENYPQNIVYADKNGTEISRSDLKPNMKIEITYGGQVMMSYPPQIVASKIQIIQ